MSSPVGMFDNVLKRGKQCFCFLFSCSSGPGTTGFDIGSHWITEFVGPSDLQPSDLVGSLQRGDAGEVLLSHRARDSSTLLDGSDRLCRLMGKENAVEHLWVNQEDVVHPCAWDEKN